MHNLALEPLNEELRCNDVDPALAFGNHKGASLQPKLLQKLVSKDVHFGYCLPLPLDKARKIPGALLAPVNIQKQNTINEQGRIVEKDCLTQPKLQMAFRDIRQQPSDHRRTPPVHVWHMHQEDCQLGHPRSMKIPQKPNPGIQV